MRHANFETLVNNQQRIVLRDLGPWSQHPTITNDAEWVVAQFAHSIGDRRLFYFDSENEVTELVVKNGRFAGFKTARTLEDEWTNR